MILFSTDVAQGIKRLGLPILEYGIDVASRNFDAKTNSKMTTMPRLI